MNRDIFILFSKFSANIKRSPQQNSFLENLCNDDFTVDDSPNAFLNFNKNDKRVKQSESLESLNNRYQKRPCLDFRNERASNNTCFNHRNDSQTSMEENMQQAEEADDLKSLRNKILDIANNKIEIDEYFMDEYKNKYTCIEVDNDIYDKLKRKISIFIEKKRERENC